jgi:uncharacterized protein
LPLETLKFPSDFSLHFPGYSKKNVRSPEVHASLAESRNVFLTAQWADLLILNYEVAPSLLKKYAPQGTRLDSFEGKTYMSLVGFRFRETKLFGTLPIPFHRDFLEVNLRFYVRRSTNSEERRGVVFIAEIVPKRMIAQVARMLYGENYLCRPMSSKREHTTVEYAWKTKNTCCTLGARVSETSAFPAQESLEQFITEHYWGYSAQRDGGCLEYQVTHPVWKVRPCVEAFLRGDPTPEYGAELASILKGKPSSSFLADGSSVVVFKGAVIT